MVVASPMRALVVLPVIAAGVVCNVARAQCEVAKVVSGAPQPLEEFGSAVCVNGDLAIVGAPQETIDDIDSAGAAYIFQRSIRDGADSWELIKRLRANDFADGDEFGRAVALDGDTAIVGAPWKDHSGLEKAGAAYIFRRDMGGANNWGFVTRIILADGEEDDDDRFGTAVAIAGDTVVIGAPKHRPPGGFTNEGSAHVLRYDPDGPSWDFVSTLSGSQSDSGDRFGAGVAIDGDTIVVGSPDNDLVGSNTGLGYIFDRDHGGPDNWGEVAWIHAQEYFESGTSFGESVDVSGDLAIVGKELSPYTSQIFQRDMGGENNWGLLFELVADDADEGGALGWVVAIDGDMAVVAADASPESVYLFQHDPKGPEESWIQRARLTPSDSPMNADYGDAISIDGDSVFVGAPRDGTDAGAAYAIDVVSADCNGNILCDVNEVAAGLGFDCDGNGVLDACEADCNGNGMADACDIEDGLSTDCNRNGIPDECDIEVLFVADSTELGPIGARWPQTFTIDDAPLAVSDVLITFTAFADLGSSDEWIAVDINGVGIGLIFRYEADDCPGTPNEVQHTMTEAEYNEAVVEGTAIMTFAATDDVDAFLCDDVGTYVRAVVEYMITDDDGKGVPGDCTPGDLDGDGQVGPADLLILLGAWGPCDDCDNCPEDLDGDCAVGTNDLVILLGNWG